MDEDRLTPQLGRLIDRAKAAALLATGGDVRAEGVALLSRDGSVFSGYGGEDPELPQASATEVALAAARSGGAADIVAAAVAVANDTADTLLPSEGCRRLLAGIDEDLPLVVKQRGRWVLVLLSELPSSRQDG